MSDPTPDDLSRLQPVALISFPDRERTNAPLPTYLTSFVDREREVEQVCGLLRRDDVRLLTLTGPGGVGKTRLAVQAAAEVAADFAAGVAFVSLAPVRDPALVGPTVAHALGVRISGDRPLADQVATALGDSELLLVLDNFEHVLEAAPLAADLLRACPRLVVLATSRERLRLGGEREVSIPPLPLPEPAAPATAAELGENAAIRLFVERAGAIDSGFALTDERVGAVAEICRRLDGLPLAIELAAARSRVLPPTALLARLERRLPLLVGGNRDAPARQQALRATIAWSYDLLEPDERAVFRRLAVFVGGFTLEAAEAVTGLRTEDSGLSDEKVPSSVHSPQSSVLELVASLVDKSLIRRQGVGEGEPRFEMLETVREFGLEQLVASGEAEDVRNRHADWCVRIAERAEDAAWGRTQRTEFDRLQADHDNVRAALAWLFDRDDARGLCLAAAMRPFWYVRGPLGEACAWLDRALAIAATDATPPALRARVLLVAGNLASRQWDQSRAEVLLGESVALWREVGDEWGLAEALFLHLLSLEDDRATLAQLEVALALFRKLAHPLTKFALMEAGLAAYELGDDERGIALLEEAHALVRQHGDEWGAGASFFRLAQVARGRGEDAQAVDYALAALNSFWGQGDQAAAIECLTCLTGLAAALGRPELAGRLLGATDRLRQALGILQTPEFERWGGLESVRAQLGNDRANDVYAAGRTLSVAETIAEARALAADLIAASENAAAAPPAPHGLTLREAEVLRLIAAGRSNQQIGEALFISPRTAQNHITHLLAKLGLPSRTAAAGYAHTHGLT